MAFGDVRGTLSVAANSITNPTAAAGSVAVQVGDLVYCVLVEQTALTVTGVTSSLVTTYTALNAGNDAVGVTGRAFYGRVTTAGTLTAVNFAATASGDNVVALAVVFEGPFSATVDANPANGTADATSPFACPPTGTLGQATELVVAWVAANHSTAYTADSPMTERLELASQTVIKGNIASKVVAATTTTTPSFTSAANPTNIVLGTSSFRNVQTLTPSLYEDADTFFAPTVAPGAVALTPSLYADADTFYAAVVASTYALTPNLYVDDDTFYTAEITQGVGGFTLEPDLYVDDDTFYSATVTSTYALAPDLYVDDDTFYSATVAATYSLTPDLYSDDDTFYAATVSATYVLLPDLYVDDDTFYSATVASTYALVPDIYVDDDTFYVATVSTTYGLLPALYEDADTFYSAVVDGSGALQLFPELYEDADVFYVAIVSSVVSLLPQLYEDGDVFYVAVVSSGPSELLPSLYNDADTFYTPTVASVDGLRLANAYQSIVLPERLITLFLGGALTLSVEELRQDVISKPNELTVTVVP